ncbi:glycosyl-transferase for dystroglycan-domain-containing protein [Amanita rubescens]|nr:glycosyl-transferase for dystroglycan-domain-containing protein [Amanita rubescens]
MKHRLSSLPCLLFLLYVSCAVLYTTNLLLLAPLKAVWAVFLRRTSTVVRERIHYSPVQRQLLSSLEDLQTYKSTINWTSSQIALEHQLGHPEPTAMDEDLFLSKAFSNSLRPSKIIPYFLRARETFSPLDITITTLITRNRLKVFTRLVEQYQGPISVAIHVKDNDHYVRELLDAIREIYASSEKISRFVDFDRQFNTWRNIARLFARTDYVMMLDIDFYLCTDFRSAIRNNLEIMSKLQEGQSAFVIPAFEYADYADGTDYAKFPRDKQTLVSLARADRIRMFHDVWAPGHNSTDYQKYYTAPPGIVYKVTRYQPAYEPYIIFKKEGPPWCDERFVGYGGNKAACLFEMYLSGTSFYVLADHFIVHQNHLYQETVRKNERKYNRKVYQDFKEEVCLRYLKTYHDLGILHTKQGSNLREECKKIKGVTKMSGALGSLQL